MFGSVGCGVTGIWSVFRDKVDYGAFPSLNPKPSTPSLRARCLGFAGLEI